MSLQSMVMKNRRMTNAMMSRIPSASHVKRGEKRAIEVANAAITRTQAYPAYLRATGTEPKPIETMEDFRRLPVIDKKGYVDRFSLPELTLDGAVAGAYTIETSSGHAGGSYYWLRRPEEDALFPQYLEYAFVQFYGMDTRRTLVLITLALGTWTSGEKMAQALREVAASGKYPLTVMAPGTDLDQILDIVDDLGPHYDQVVIVGYPPFIKTVVDEGVRRGIDWKSMGVKLGLGGEGYSEEWREHMAEVIGVDSRKDLLAISGGYGAADIGMTVGREYPLTVLIRKLCLDDPDLARTLFSGGGGSESVLPGLVQYNPAGVYMEDVGRELTFTVLSGVPLVRYNIHDRGSILQFDDVMDAVRDHGYDPIKQLQDLGYGLEQVWKLPFFYVYGRSDGTVSIVGANIFPENIQAVLSRVHDQDIRTFKLSVETGADYSQRLAIALEHYDAGLSDEDAAALSSYYHDVLVTGLMAVNPDFKDAYEDNPQSADPAVTVYRRDAGPFDGHTAIKNSYIDRAGEREPDPEPDVTDAAVRT